MNKVLTDTLKAIKIDTLSGGFVFQSSHGTPYRTLRISIERVVRRAGIKDFAFQDWRCAFASRLVMRQGDLVFGFLCEPSAFVV